MLSHQVHSSLKTASRLFGSMDSIVISFARGKGLEFCKGEI